MKKIIWVIIFAAIIFTGLALLQKGKPAATTASADYKSATYSIEDSSVTLSEGYSETPAAPGSASMVTTKYFGDDASGDLNGDGVADAAFLLTQDGGGTGTFYYAAAALKTPTGWTGTNAIYLGDRIAPQTTSIQDGKITVNYADRKPGEAMTVAPSVGVSKYLKISGGRLVEISADGSVVPQVSDQAALQNNPQNKMTATLHTTKGDITMEFYPKEAPNASANFLKLAKAGFYDRVKFHRVIAGFMIQGGDPLTKDDSKQAAWGTGGPGYKFADEIGSLKNDAGMVAMANSGPNTNGSQFFINLKDNDFLNGGYTVFGKVTAGMDVVNAIGITKTDSSDRPIVPVVINSFTVSQ